MNTLWICTLCDSTIEAYSIQATNPIPQPPLDFCPSCHSGSEMFAVDTSVHLNNNISSIPNVTSKSNLESKGGNGEHGDIHGLNQREDYVATLVHDLKTPLLAASRALKLLIEGDFGSVSKDQQAVMKAIIHSNEMAYKLISKLLEVYRVDNGVKTLTLDFEDLSKLIIALDHELSPLAREKGVLISKSLPERNRPVLCDGAEIKRVLQNLIDNAIKFTAPGGTIEIAMTQSSNVCQISVKDNGHGIAEEDKNKIFERYWQQGPKKTNNASTGLGLYLCRKIVELHGGTISFESQRGIGSNFSFKIPMEPVEFSAGFSNAEAAS